MRKRTIRSGMRLVLAALILIVLASFYHVQLSDLFLLPPYEENRFYQLGMFWAAAIGGYGVVVTVFGFLLAPDKNDSHVRIMPVAVGILVLIVFFFYLLSSSMDTPASDEQQRLRPGETITI